MVNASPKVISSTDGLLRFDKAAQWLTCSPSTSTDKRYQHSLLQELNGQRASIVADLKLLVERAHDDARQMLRSLADYNLDPLDSTQDPDPAKGYPERLELQVLKGYFGEIFAGIVAETYRPFGHQWKVPALLFRFHNIAFDQLERWRQTGQLPGPIPGRTGDDNLAFQFDSTGKIIAALFCEAKCTADHDTHMIEDAHKKISDAVSKPVEILRLIKLLRDYPDENSRKWIVALQQLYWQEINPASYERFDLVCYVYGRSPIQPNKKSWIPANQPHAEYKGRRRLQAVEIHIHDVDAFVKEIYNKK